MKIHPQLRGRNLLTLCDLSDAEMADLVTLASRLKDKKRGGDGAGAHLLAGRNLAMVFEKSSTRTRCAATVAANDEGAHIEYLGKHDIHLGKKESVEDTARVLGRMFDGIFFRGFEHERVARLAAAAGVPVWNGLTDDAHPTQILADLQTVHEHFGTLKGLKAVYVGDGRNNVCRSLMLGCAKMGIDFVNCCPPELAPSEADMSTAVEKAGANGCTSVVEQDPDSAVRDANVIYTDVWASMGEEEVFAERARLLRPYQVTMEMMENTGHVGDDAVIFLHCLPAFHNRDTAFTAELGALEVTDDVFEAPFSKVFDEAENRMHTIKAMMVATLY